MCAPAIFLIGYLSIDRHFGLNKLKKSIDIFIRKNDEILNVIKAYPSLQCHSLNTMSNFLSKENICFYSTHVSHP